MNEREFLKTLSAVAFFTFALGAVFGYELARLLK